MEIKKQVCKNPRCKAKWIPRVKKPIKCPRCQKMIKYVIAFLLITSTVQASQAINVEKLANAIYIAEGGAKTNHPYGILAKYKNTTPRQACINTINHAIRDWDGEGDFITFLGNRYAPIGADNDPKGLNKNWVKNVRFYYGK